MTKPSEGSGAKDNRRGIESLTESAAGLSESAQRAGTVAAASYTLIGAIIFLGGLGYFADRWLGTDPWLLVVGLIFGIIVGFYELARVVWRRTR